MHYRISAESVAVGQSVAIKSGTAPTNVGQAAGAYYEKVSARLFDRSAGLIHWNLANGEYIVVPYDQKVLVTM